MDYLYPKKEPVKLDCETEKAICEIKVTLQQLVSKLDMISDKVEDFALNGNGRKR